MRQCLTQERLRFGVRLPLRAPSRRHRLQGPREPPSQIQRPLAQRQYPLSQPLALTNRDDGFEHCLRRQSISHSQIWLSSTPDSLLLHSSPTHSDLASTTPWVFRLNKGNRHQSLQQSRSTSIRGKVLVQLFVQLFKKGAFVNPCFGLLRNCFARHAALVSGFFQ